MREPRLAHLQLTALQMTSDKQGPSVSLIAWEKRSWRLSPLFSASALPLRLTVALTLKLCRTPNDKRQRRGELEKKREKVCHPTLSFRVWRHLKHRSMWLQGRSDRLKAGFYIFVRCRFVARQRSTSAIQILFGHVAGIN
jgi:hypothetical protein